MALLNYQVGSVEVQTYKDIPAGEYLAMITDSEQRDTTDRTGQYLQLKIQIADGDHKGHVLFERLNLWNRNETAVNIANQTLESICRAVGVTGVLADSVQLHDKLFIVKVTYKERERQKGVMVELDEGRRNGIAGYKPNESASFAPQQPFAATTAPTATMPPPVSAAGASGEAAPWDKK